MFKPCNGEELYNLFNKYHKEKNIKGLDELITEDFFYTYEGCDVLYKKQFLDEVKDGSLQYFETFRYSRDLVYIPVNQAVLTEVALFDFHNHKENVKTIVTFEFINEKWVICSITRQDA